MNYILFIPGLWILIGMNLTPDNNKFKITIFSQDAKIATIGIEDIQKVQWNQQCYEFKKGSLLDTIKIDRGRVEFSYNNKVFLTANIYQARSSVIVYPLIFSVGGGILTNNSFCVLFKNNIENKDTVLEKLQVQNFLKKKGVLGD